MTDSNNSNTAGAPQPSSAGSQPTSGSPQAAPQSAERPPWLPEGFNSGEDLAARYAELQRQQSESQSHGDEVVPANNSEAAVLLNEAGLDFAKFEQEYLQKGALSDQSYEALERAGISAEVVDSYIEGQQAQADEFRNQVFATAGGQEAFTEMVSWAADGGMTKNEVNAYNAMINSGDQAMMQQAIEGLKSRFTAEHGTTPRLMGGSSGHGHSGAGDVYSTTAEVTAAMKDSRYASDPDYRQQVIAKLGRSNVM